MRQSPEKDEMQRMGSGSVYSVYLDVQVWAPVDPGRPETKKLGVCAKEAGHRDEG